MSRWLKYDEYVPYAPSKLGATVNIYHCKQGKDNDRLFITRSDDGNAILAYCHHCGKRGRYSEPFNAVARAKEGVPVSYRRHNYPKTGYSNNGKERVYYMASWPPQARLFIKRYGITELEVTRHGIYYSTRTNRVVFPVSNISGVVGSEARRVLLDDEGPKWRSSKHSSVVGSYYHYINNNSYGSLRCCVVEDVVSAIKCSRYISAYALLGSGYNDMILLDIASKFSEVIIFMDNDNRQIKMKQAKLKQDLELLGLSARIVHGSKDPKEYSDGELKETLI